MTDQTHDKTAPVAQAQEPDEHRIRARAHQIWVAEGKPDGRALDHWLRAKWELVDEDVVAERERLNVAFARPDEAD